MVSRLHSSTEINASNPSVLVKMNYIDLHTQELDFSQYNLAEDQVFVIDNLFPDYFIHYVDDLIMNSYGWFYGHTSNYPTDGHDIGADPEWKEVAALKQQIFPGKSPHSNDGCFKMIMDAVINSIDFDMEIGEILVNGQQWIHHTFPHQDCPCDNGLSFIYYVNKTWYDDWGGSTKILLNDEWIEVPPKPGRVCFFKGNIPHHGNPPNETYRGLRATLVYKFMRKVPLPPNETDT